MAGDPLQLGGDHPQPHTPRRRLDSGQLLDGKHVRLVVQHRTDVIHAIRQRNDLHVRPLLRQFFRTAMQIAENGFDVDDLFAVESDAHPENTMSRRVLRTKVDRDRLCSDLRCHDPCEPPLSTDSSSANAVGTRHSDSGTIDCS